MTRPSVWRRWRAHSASKTGTVHRSSRFLPQRRRAGRRTFPSRRVILCYLAVLILAALLLRAWFASGWPDESRSWDERYSFENVASVLETGSIRPVRNFYPSPVYFGPPALAILLAQPFVDNPRVALFDPEQNRFGPIAYHLARGIQVLYGTASVLLIYLLGTMVFSRQVGLFAATVLAFLPWHIQISGIFKPDAQVVFFVLVVLIAGVRWMHSPSTLAALCVGGAVALATSSKLIAGVSGAAFAIGGSVRAQARQYWHILLAGGASVALFLLLNPHIDIVLAGIEDIKRDYAMRAGWAGMTKAQIPLRTLDYLLEPVTFGPILGVLALAGYVALWLSGVRSARSDAATIAAPRLMLASFPLFYVAVHTAQSAWFRDNNFTHILPFFALALAWALVALLHFARQRLQVPGLIVGTAGVGVLVLLASPGPLYVYRTYTPSTLDIAYKTIHAQVAKVHGRVMIIEPVEAPGVPWRGGRELSTTRGPELRVSSASELATERRKRSDAEILLGRVPNEVSPERVVRRRVVSPALGERRGPELTLLLHPWTRRATHGPLAIRRREDKGIVVELSCPGSSDLVSIGLRVGRPPALTPETSPTVVYGDETIPLHRTESRDRWFDLVSERFPCRETGRSPARIEGLPPLAGASLEAFLAVWSPPERDRAGE